VSGDPPTSPIPTSSVIDEVIELRRHFHRHPEVSFSEHATSKHIGDRLRELGLELKPCPTETGVVAVLDTGRPGKTVMLRADIDALPIHEESGVKFSWTDVCTHAGTTRTWGSWSELHARWSIGSGT
jgi:metal-dependent amidase/aminoacylase/carboxypeptidase family protein